MMLDLNLSVASNCKEIDSNNSCNEEEEEGGADSAATSNSYSSVVNGADAGEAASSNATTGDDDTPSSSDQVFTFNFGILKVNANGQSREPELFPAGARYDGHGPVAGPNRSRNNWVVDLSFGGHQQQQKLQQQQVKKSRRGPRSRSSQYRGVTFYRRTGRWESHIWDCGKQVYLGGFDTAHAAARAYDRAAIKFRGVDADINFNISDYDDMKQMKNLTKEEFVHILRRQSTGFSRGSSKYRGVTLHKCGRWEARMGQFLGKKAYDKAAIKCNGREAVTNFEPSTYEPDTTSQSTLSHPHNRNEGTQFDLDLNLGISTSSGKEHGSLRSVHYHPYDVQNATMSKMDLSSTIVNPLKGLPLTSEHPQLWSGAYSTFIPNFKERATETRIEVGSSQGPPKWAWQMQNQLKNATPMSVLSTAASSGFQSPATTASSPPSKVPNAASTLNLCFVSFPTSSANTTTATTTTTQYRYQQLRPHWPPPQSSSHFFAEHNLL